MVDLSMPGYIEAALQKFQHVPSKRPQHAPHKAETPTYQRSPQLAPAPDLSPPLSSKQKNRMQQVLGTLLFYAHAVDLTMLVAINSITAQQAAPTENTTIAIVYLLNYVATHPDAVIHYSASGMVLHIHSDASFMLESCTRSQAGGHYFCSNTTKDPANATEDEVPLNGPVHSVCEIMRNVMASTVEADVSALFINARKGGSCR
eukprot:4909734-Ditylum_brightwellii.AAC.1